MLCGDCNGWFETGACRNVLIRNKRFINALTNMFQFTEAVISIYPEIPDLEHQKKYFHGGKGEKGVVIDSCLPRIKIILIFSIIRKMELGRWKPVKK